MHMQLLKERHIQHRKIERGHKSNNEKRYTEGDVEISSVCQSFDKDGPR
jgi:hypothetical protein